MSESIYASVTDLAQLVEVQVSTTVNGFNFVTTILCEIGHPWIIKESFSRIVLLLCCRANFILTLL